MVRTRCRYIRSTSSMMLPHVLMRKWRGLHFHPTLAALNLEPLVELRRARTVGAGLLLCRAHSKVVRILVLRMTVVPTHPLPLRLVRQRGGNELLPQREVLDRTTLAHPTAPR